MVGDVFGEPGRNMLEQHLLKTQKDTGADFVIVNGENAAHGQGITQAIAQHWYDHLGIDVITTGNHAFDVQGIQSYFDQEPRLLRPINYPAHTAGRGFHLFTSRSGCKVLVINVMGQVHMPRCDDPFGSVDQILSHHQAEIIVIDMHAEATSESQAMGWHCDGRVSAVLGTHTHVPTLDLKILPGGTAYVTDIGMTGPYGGVIGMDREASLQRFYTKARAPFIVAQSDPQFHAVLVTCEQGRAVRVERIQH